MNNPVLSLQNLSKFYTGSQSVVIGLNRVTLELGKGEFVAVTGESGSGKSTLAHVLGGILPYESGEMLFLGKPTSHFDGSDWEKYRRDNISFISQGYGILPGCTVFKNVVTALRLSGLKSKEAKLEAERILKQVELWDFKNHRAGKLSSGQKQRLSIARALAKPSPILLADEPTGNLDSENSKKVIELLSLAAKDRLVILITHEFSEAEAYVTRHINLRDGSVVSDRQLREPELVSQDTRTALKKRALGLHIAGVQLSGRPVWTALMLAFFTLTAFAVFALLGTFIVNLDDTSTRIYDNSAFRNGNMERIVVVRSDSEQLTDKDIESILALNHTKSLQPYGYACDINYFYREGIDYGYHYSVNQIGEDYRTSEESVELYDTELYIQSIPLFADAENFITSGRAPENYYEIVAVGDKTLLGKTITVYFRDVKNWNFISHLCFEMEIVGVTNYGSGLYFHNDLVSTLSCQLHQNNFIYAPAKNGELSGTDCLMSAEMYMMYKFPDDDIFPWDFFPYTEGSDFVSTMCIGSHEISHNGLVIVSAETFDSLKNTENADQATLYIDDYAYTERVLDELHKLGYIAVSPFLECSTEQDPVLAKQRMDTLVLCLAALAVVFALQIVVLWAMFSMENESYKLLGNIGLSYRTARNSLLWQLIIFGLCGQLIAFIGILAAAAANAEAILAIFRYMEPLCWLILSLVHIAGCAVAAVRVLHSMKKQVFPFAALPVDIVMDEEAEL